MNSLVFEIDKAQAKDIQFDEDSIVVQLMDGRTITAPLAWYPRLVQGTVRERNNWRFIGQGEGVHWPDLDEDISISHIVFGKPSLESQKSLNRWLEQRQKGK